MAARAATGSGPDSGPAVPPAWREAIAVVPPRLRTNGGQDLSHPERVGV